MNPWSKMSGEWKWSAACVALLILGATITSPGLTVDGNAKTTSPPTTVYQEPPTALEATTTTTLPAAEVSMLAAAVRDRRTPDETTTTTVAAVAIPRDTTAVTAAPPAAPKWQPRMECQKVRNPGPVYLTAATMGWCAKVADYLDLGERKGLWRWQPGDLTRLLLIIECESNGEANPGGSNPLGSLFQHDGRYWPDRAPRAARDLNFDNPTRHYNYPYDSIAVGVWLFKIGRSGGVRGGAGHWLSCSGYSPATATGRVVQATLRNMGLPIPTQRWNA